MPDTFTVKRSLDIRAPAELLLPRIADFHAWAAWSPYEKRDPALKRTFGGAATGVGAVEAAHRSAVHQAVQGPQYRRIHPRPSGRQHDGHMGDVRSAMGLFIDMDRMIGKDFEAGLQNLKAIAEK